MRRFILALGILAVLVVARPAHAQQFSTLPDPHQNSAAPTCSTNCGTGSSIAGTDRSGFITMGATGTPASPFTVTFAVPFTVSAPVCNVMMAKTGMVIGKIAMLVLGPSNLTNFVVTTNGTAPANGDVYSYHCSDGL